MALFGKRWESDGRDALSPMNRMLLSVLVTGVMGFLLEYIGTQTFHVYSYTDSRTFYIVVAVFAFALGPVLVFLRKAAMLVPMMMVALSMMAVEFFNHYFFINWELVNGVFHESGVLTSPRIWEWHNGAFLGIRHPALIAVVAGVAESVLVPASVWTQKLLTLGLRKQQSIRLDEVEDFFKSSVSPLADFRVKRDFAYVFLRSVSLAFAVYLLYLLLGLVTRAWDLPLIGSYVINPAATINSFGKITLLFSLASVGAFNSSIRRSVLLLLVVGHVFTVGVAAWLYFGYAPNPLFPADHQFVLSSGVLDGILLVILVILFLGSRESPEGVGDVQDIDVQSPASILLKALLLAFGILYVMFTAGGIFSRILAPPDSVPGALFGGPDPLIINILTKYGTLAALSFFLFARPALRRYLIPTLTLVLSVSVAATFIYGLYGSTVITTQLGTKVTIPWFIILQVLVDGGGLIILLAIRRMQYQVDYQITSLRPGSAECVMALHRALRDSSQRPELSARQVLQRLDEHIVGIRSRRRGLIGFPFWMVEHLFPIVSGLRGQFSVMSPDEGRWMMRRYVLRPGYERARASVPGLADFLYQIGDAVNALLNLAYFTTRSAHGQIGYVLPEARERLQTDVPVERPPVHAGATAFPRDFADPAGKRGPASQSTAGELPAASVSVPRPSKEVPDEVDYCVIGSGAAGGVLAHRLSVAKGNSSSICVIERGGYYSSSVDFSSDEMRMIRMLYADGGLQMTRTFDFIIAQGECVGGTTVINNAICLKMPEVSRKEWSNRGIDVSRIDAHYERVKGEINIDVLKPVAVNHVVENLFREGVKGYNSSPSGYGRISPADMLEGNFAHCIGCGLCNIGCKYLRKLSVLETYIPWAQANGVNVLSGVSAVQCATDRNQGRKKVTSLVVRMENGEFRKIRIRKALVVAAGAIASSRFLMRSELGGAGVGQNLSCNYAFPTSVEFDQTIDAFDGLQITLSAAPESSEAIFETYFNPPAAYAISTAAYFDRHAHMMQAYRRSLNFGALVGSDPSGSVSRKRDIMFGRAIQWNQTEGELSRIRRALATVVWIAKAAGGKRAILPTHPALTIPLDASTGNILANFDRILNDKRYFNFFTAHPQGGNMMAGSSAIERVVDTDFRVRDCDNLYVCDASVFPRSIRVNPQWTIMALASLAGERIAAES